MEFALTENLYDRYVTSSYAYAIDPCVYRESNVRDWTFETVDYLICIDDCSMKRTYAPFTGRDTCLNAFDYFNSLFIFELER